MSIKIFIINLKSCKDRREKTLSECKKIGFSAEIFTAIDGRELTQEQLNVMVKDHTINGLTKGEIGCSLSHIGVYKKICDEKIERALILEDDIAFNDNIPNVLKEVEKFDKTVDEPFVYLLSFVKSRIENRINIFCNIKFYDVYRADLACGYVINLKAAQNLQDYLYPVRFTADDWKFFKFGAKINIKAVLPEVVYGYQTESCISEVDGEFSRINFKKHRRKYRPKLFCDEFSVFFKIFLFRVFKRPFLKVYSHDNHDSPFSKIKRFFRKIKIT
jgi:glycosyl transferase family 25